ncbi:MAG TPA: outer membrane beta-barrel family protein, partial [Longimicrobiales bacterium]|nr:outer membrane beta-barrel family protein [Longimicrobiales bacterium]
RDYNTIFPSLSVGFAPKPGRNVRFSYSKSIGRPPATFLNPYVPSTDPLNLSVGNPDLRPSYSHSARLEYSWTGARGTLRIAPMYRRQVDLWERIRTVDTLGVSTTRWENAASADYLATGVSVSLPPTRALSGSMNFTVYRDVRDGSNISTAYRSRGIGWSVGGNLGYKFAPSLTAQMFMSYNPKQFILQGRASGFTYMSLGIRQQLWGTKGSLGLNISDPLGLSRFDSSTRDPTYIQNSRSSFTQRAASLSFTYNFGKPPQQRSSRVGTDEGAGETIRVR